MDDQQDQRGVSGANRAKGVALGAGAGMIVGAALGSPGVGLVLGAALGLIVGPSLVRKME